MGTYGNENTACDGHVYTPTRYIDRGKKIVDDNKDLIKSLLLSAFGCKVQFTVDLYEKCQVKVLAYINSLNYHKHNSAAYTTTIKDRNKSVVIARSVIKPSTCFLCKDKGTICIVEFKQCFDTIENQYMANSVARHMGSNNILAITFIGKNAKLYRSNVIKIYKKYGNKTNNGIECIAFYDPIERTPYMFKLRTFDSVIFRNKPKLLEVVDKFIDSREIYYKFSITYQLGILLYGAPGCGKTTIIRALTKYIADKHVDGCSYWFNLGACKSSKQVDQMIAEFKKSVNENDYVHNKFMNIVIIEELDQICDGLRDDNAAVTVNTKAKINSLLQFLDGVNSCDNTIVIATTNYLDKLDPALIRDGRFSCKLEVGPFDDDEVKEMCARFDIDPSVADDLPKPVIPVDLQTRIFNQLIN